MTKSIEELALEQKQLEQYVAAMSEARVTLIHQGYWTDEDEDILNAYRSDLQRVEEKLRGIAK